MAANDLVLALTGASGAPYGVRLLEVLLAAGRTVHLTLSDAAAQVIHTEMGRRVSPEHFQLADLLGKEPDFPGQVQYHDHRNFLGGSPAGRSSPGAW